MVFLSICHDPVSNEATSKILEQMNCICSVKIKETGFGTGFFCYIYYKNKKLPVLMSNNHIITEKILKSEEKLYIEINNEEKKIRLNGRIKYTNEKYYITIIEIKPEIDRIYNFLEIDDNIFYGKELRDEVNKSIYILQRDIEESFVSYGIIKNISEDEINFNYLLSAMVGSSGSAIMNLRNLKIIGIHITWDRHNHEYFGTLLKYPINEFININKDYLEKIIEPPRVFSFESDKNEIKGESNFNNFNKKNSGLEYSFEKEKEKNRELEEQIKKLKTLLNNSNNNNINNYKDINTSKEDVLIESILKKDKEIEELKTKLARFPFLLLQGEKLMSIIITSVDKKINCSIICKNTDIFYNIESKLNQKYHEYSDKEKFFTVNGKIINKNENLDYNQIKDNDIIILNEVVKTKIKLIKRKYKII